MIANVFFSNKLEYISSLSISVFGFIAGFFIIPRAAKSFDKAGQFGIDIGKFDKTNLAEKEKRPHVPEGLGLVIGVIFLIALQLLSIFVENEKIDDKITILFVISALLLFLGFSDDVLDIRWKYKIYISAICTIPLIHFTWNNRSIILPKFLGHIINKDNVVLDLGILYLVFVFLLTIFCINSINIYAGINGLEIGQSVIISIFSVVYSAISLLLNHSSPSSPFESLTHSDNNCIFVIIVSLPFIFTSAALFHYNKYPSKVFVGDSYTHFAGATLAATGVAGGFPFVLLLLFLPQVINFVLSLPQLFSSYYPAWLNTLLRRIFSARVAKILTTCPRHRVPEYDVKRMVTKASPNLTLINAVLYVFGPQKEKNLVLMLLALQLLIDTAIIALCFLGVLPWL